MERVHKGLLDYYKTRCLDINIGELKLIGNGMESQVYSYKTVSGCKCETRVLRLFEKSEAIPPAERAQREYQGLQWLYLNDYPVPKVYDKVDEESFLGASFIVFEKVDGVPLWSYLNKAGDYERKLLGRKSIELFARLHALPFHDFPQQPAGNVIDEELSMLSEYIERFEKHGFGKAIQHLQETSKTIKPEPAVVHGDFHFDNILLRPNGKQCVIDWTMVGINDYRVDIGWSLALMGDDRTLRDTLIKWYEEASNKPIKHLDFFEAYGALRRLGLFGIVLQDGPEAIGLKPGTDDRLRQYMGGHIRRLYQDWLDITAMPLPEIKPYFDGLLD